MTDYSNGPSPTELRAGDLVRVIRSRSVQCSCQVCGARFSNTGAAASHARARRHRISVSYSVEFDYEPAELRGGGK